MAVQQRPTPRRSRAGRGLAACACSALAASLWGPSFVGAGQLQSPSARIGRPSEAPARRSPAAPGAPLGVRRQALPEALEGVQALLDTMPDKVAELGPLGPLYFFAIYVIAEVLSLPAAPLTLSAGYLFGLQTGCAIVIAAGFTAACIGFLLARTLLAPQVSKMAAENEMFQNINKAVEREGFTIIFLLRLSPLLPFALSNYVFGTTKVPFKDFALATAIGFTPGATALVYLSTQARELATEGATQPWYVYAAGVAFTFGLLKVVTDVASKAVDNAIEADKAEQAAKESSMFAMDFENLASKVLTKEPVAPNL